MQSKERQAHYFKALVFECYIDYVKKHHPNFDIDQLIEKCGLSKDYLDKKCNWVGAHFDFWFTKAMVKLDKDLPFKAGSSCYKKNSLGRSVAKFAKLLGCSHCLYLMAPKMNWHFNKIFEVTLLDFSKGSFYLFKVELIRSRVENGDYKFIKLNLPHIYRNYIGHYCAVSAMASDDPTMIAPYTIISEDEDALFFKVNIGDIAKNRFKFVS